MAVRFEDNRVKVEEAINAAAMAWLEEAAGEIEAQVKRNAKVGKVNGGKTKDSWDHKTDAEGKEAYIGSNLENAIWEEYGTGDYAEKGDGRAGGWYIPIGTGTNEIDPAVVEAYHMKVVVGKGGKKFAYTKGKRPKRTMRKAFETTKAAVEKSLENRLRGL